MTATIPFTQTPHLIEQQYAAEQQFLQQFAKASYTPQAPLIIINPYLIAPLTALIMFRTDTAQSVQLKVCGKEPIGDLHISFPAALEPVSYTHLCPLHNRPKRRLPKRDKTRPKHWTADLARPRHE